MTYGRVKNEALKLLNGYSIAGAGIPSSYNNQADYLARIPGLVDDAQMYIATTAKKISTTIPLEEVRKTPYGGMYLCSMPENCWQLSGAGLAMFADSDDLSGRSYARYHGLKRVERNKFILPKSVADDPHNILLVEYFRYPVLLGESPADNSPLDNVPETHSMIPYYVAAHLAIHDDFSVYTSLYNEFETRLARLGEALETEVWTTEDVYDAGADGGVSNGY